MNSNSSPRPASAASSPTPLQGLPHPQSLRSQAMDGRSKDAPRQHAHNYQRSIQSYLEKADQKASAATLRDGPGPSRERHRTGF